MVMDRDARGPTTVVLAIAVGALVIGLLLGAISLLFLSAFCGCGGDRGCACDLGRAFEISFLLAIAAVVAGLLRMSGSRSSLLALAAIGALSAVLGGVIVVSRAAATYEDVGGPGVLVLLSGLVVAVSSVGRFMQGDPEEPAAPDAGSPPT
jgi:hypothetical protein